MRFRSIVICVLATGVVAVTLSPWRPRPAAEVGEPEKSIDVPPTTEPTPRPSPSPLAAPTLSELQPILDRVFDQTLTVDQATRPAFVAGDFNGDDVTDLAVGVRPRNGEAASRLNAAMSSWTVGDATAPTSTPVPVRVAAGDLLLAVVHGIDGGGWRNPNAGQGYLMKNAVGSGLRLRPLAGVPAAIRMRASRTHVGDVIAGSRGDQRGLIFWTGVAYVWADLKAGE